MSHIAYLFRVLPAYLFNKKSQLSFWHESPGIHTAVHDGSAGPFGPYYMPFSQKAGYTYFCDGKGIPRLNYGGKIGIQYNPIAVSQYGLGNYNLFLSEGAQAYLDKAKRAADWLVENLEPNTCGLYVWHHHFDWEYRQVLKSPWYSALAQGQGISLLLRLYEQTREPVYLESSRRALESLMTEIPEGGVVHVDREGDWWLEEYIVDPPTHILNGFIWALWGIYDFMKCESDGRVRELWARLLRTLEKNLPRYDTGFWSLYDLSRQNMKNLASPFYHDLHITQLEILFRITNTRCFRDCSEKWASYKRNFFFRNRALIEKAFFKLVYF